MFKKAALVIVAALLWAAHAESKGNADRDWEALTSSASRPARHAQEGSLAYFMRSVELSDIRRRELGLKFWNRYPDDARRYQWLLTTVRLPPHYAQNIDEWARNETRIERRPYAVDVKAEQRWTRMYPGMRQAFWAAPGITEEERRFLRYSEVRAKLKRMLDEPARIKLEDITWVTQQTADIAGRYPQALSALDSGRYYIGTLATKIFSNAAALGMDVPSQMKFAEQLQTTGNEQVVPGAKQAAKRLSEGRTAYPSFEEQGADTRGLRKLDFVVFNGADSLNFGTPAGDIAYYYDHTIASRKYRDFGIQMWDSVQDREDRKRWLLGIQGYGYDNYGALYMKNFVDGVRAIAENMTRAPEVLIDEDAEREWDSQYARMRAQLLDDPQATDAERSMFKSAGLTEQINRAARLWIQKHDRSGVQALLDEARTREKDRAGGADGILTEILRYQARLGITEEELHAFMTSLVDSSKGSASELVQNQQNLYALRTSAIEIKAPTLAGAPFDLKSLRGKIVLVDFWATTCGTCIQAFPRIKDVYDRYKHRGFEVVSVCLDAEAERRKVEKAERNLKLTWTTLAADSLWPELKKRYGYNGVPQYMLLDRNGKRVAGTAEVDLGHNLQALLDGMLQTEN